MWIDIIIMISVGLPIFLASEYFLPSVFSGTRMAERQRHFYSILIAIFSLGISATLRTNFVVSQQTKAVEDVFTSAADSHLTDIRQQIAAIEKVFTSVADSHMKQHFQDIFTNYHRHFRQPCYSHLLEPWVNQAITSLSDEMNQISVSLPSSTAKDKVFDLYESANDYIFVTHVGPLNQYFDDQRHKEANLSASRRGIPIVRFYLFDGEVGTIENPENRNEREGGYLRRSGVTLSQFNAQVGQLHQDMGTLMSVVIPPHKLNAGQRRHLLMVDGAILAETMPNAGITRATGEAKAVGRAQAFLRQLLGTTVSSDYVHHLDNAEVRNRFKRYSRSNRLGNETHVAGPEGEPLAKTIARFLLQGD